MVEQDLTKRTARALLAVFERFVSPINARALVRSVAQKSEESSDPEILLRHLSNSMAFLVASDKRDVLLAAARVALENERAGLEPLTAPPASESARVTPPRHPPTPRVSEARAATEPESKLRGSQFGEVLGPSVTIAKESDLNEARLVARQLCQQAGLQGFAAQKLVTAVSELTRNVAKYASPGRVVFSNDLSRRRLRVVVSDQGPGIPRLEEVLNGKYRSKTGMGLGLLGTKKLVDEFDIVTGSTGTTVTICVRY